MRIETLTLKGFLGFGGEVALDLRDVPAGLIAICGPNGAGKTTVLEAAPATLFREWMSRGDVVNYATGRDSFLELRVGLDGRGTYVARLNVDGVKRGSDAVLSQIGPDGSTRFLNDGKVSTYAAAVAEIFPSREVLLASAFSAQNKAGSFTSLDRKNRKALFAELLGIERYQSMSEVAKQAGRLVAERRTAVSVERSVISEAVSPAVVEEIDATAQRLQVEGGRAELDQIAIGRDLAEAEARLATLAEAAAAYASAELLVATMSGKVFSATADLERIATQVDRTKANGFEAVQQIGERTVRQAKEVNAERERADGRLALELEAADEARDAVIRDVESRRAGNVKIQQQADAIKAATTAVADLDLKLEGLAAAREAVQNDATAVGERLETRRATLRALESKSDRLQTAARTASLLDSVPCGGEGKYATCALISDAKTAEALAITLRAETEGLHDARRAVTEDETALARHKESVDDLAAQQTTLRTHRSKHVELSKYANALAASEARLAELQTLAEKAEADRHAQRLAAVERHQEASARCEQRLADVTRAGSEDVAREEAKTGAALEELAKEAERLTGEIHENERKLAEARTDAAALADRSVAVRELQARIASLRARWDETTGIIARVAAGREDLNRRRDELSARLVRRAQLDAVLDVLEADLLDWQTLEQYLGRDGLQKLEIDAAGPTVAAYTNQLLEVCYGTRFSVDIVTQVEKAGGKGLKEDFAVLVLDNERGGEPRDLADLSGGEQVIVAEALSAAICIYSNTRSGAPIRTCWRDETTGALDPANADRYIAMLRKMQELGGFEHVLFISHNPDAAAQADAQIQIKDGRVALAFPPYAVSEAA